METEKYYSYLDKIRLHPRRDNFTNARDSYTFHLREEFTSLTNEDSHEVVDAYFRTLGSRPRLLNENDR